MSRTVLRFCVLALVSLSLCCGRPLNAQTIGPQAEDLAKARERGINFLKSSQAAGGYWTSPDVPGITALVAYSLMLNGVPVTDPVVDKALAQLLKNSQPDGGIYSPKGQNGSMTYAGLKSMIYAGLTPEDPRIKAATEWITKFYTVEENPGMGQQGVLYYYHMFAKALSTL